MTTVVISQPMYFPWAGFLAQMALADVLIWLDDAQFSKGSFTNRVQVKTARGTSWMTVPLEGKGSFREIRDLAPGREGWQTSHRALLAQALDGQPHLDAALGLFDAAVAAEPLADALIASAEVPARAIGVLPRQRRRSSALGVPGRSWRRVLDLVRAVGGTRYVTGHGALGYLDHEAFETAGVKVDYMDYRPRPWPQRHGPFTPFVTGLELVASVGTREAAAFLQPATLGWRRFRAAKAAGMRG